MEASAKEVYAAIKEEEKATEEEEEERVEAKEEVEAAGKEVKEGRPKKAMEALMGPAACLSLRPTNGWRKTLRCGKVRPKLKSP